jgi:hypothetical protein
VHIIRYEDILTNPYDALKDCLEFILNVEDITGTKVHSYLEIAVKQESPKMYKPREGKQNKNAKKFS